MIKFLVTFFILIFAFAKYVHLKDRYEKLNKFLQKYLSALTSARYGNLYIKCEGAYDNFTNVLCKTTNDLIESVKDRDKMINEYIEKEKQSQNLKQDFVSSLAHDFKVPIIAQDNTYDLLLEDKFGVLDTNIKDVIQNLKISNNDLKNLVLDLLDAHKFENSNYNPEYEKFVINELIDEVIEQNASIFKIKNKNIVFSANNDIVLYADNVLIKRALNNLISNAIYHGKNTKNIYIDLSSNSSYVEISVTDEGEGIKEKDIQTLFKKYYRACDKYSNIGVGLGLYITNKIALSHNGCLKAKNTKDKGAKFTLVLPLNLQS
ncbi:HAMP domain-containing histidine kinase [bacterium]|nr:HAMP domain-containing histidine kinase [bacterium]